VAVAPVAARCGPPHRPGGGRGGGGHRPKVFTASADDFYVVPDPLPRARSGSRASWPAGC